MLVVKLLILFILVAIFIQDIRSRAVYWMWFPLMASGLLYIRLEQSTDAYTWGKQVGSNLFLLCMQLLMLTGYFSIKKSRLINITDKMIGWGDLLFLFSVTVYFSVGNFMFFYIFSLIVSLFVWLLLRAINVFNNEKIPLAGFQAILLILFLFGEWWFRGIDMADDHWLINLIIK